jgi:hypothetical protein
MPCHRRPSALLLRTFGPATAGLRADVGKGRACPPRLLDGELLLLVRAFCPVQRRRTDAVLLLRSTAALVGPAGPFPPIRPKACPGIAQSVGQPSLNVLSRATGRVFRGTARQFCWFRASRKAFRGTTGRRRPGLLMAQVQIFCGFLRHHEKISF